MNQLFNEAVYLTDFVIHLKHTDFDLQISGSKTEL